MLQNYVLILANSGLRTGEARTLRWGDCHKQFRMENGRTVSDMILSVKGKTGKRDVVAAQDTVETCLKRLWGYRKNEVGKEPPKTEPVFTNHQGKAVTSFKKSFSSLLKECGLEQSTDGEKRTLYSLRHTYATFRLDEGMSINDLRLNMGTSVKMIETYYYHALNRRRAAEMKIMKTDRLIPEVQDALPWEK
jgi:integrase